MFVGAQHVLEDYNAGQAGLRLTTEAPQSVAKKTILSCLMEAAQQSGEVAHKLVVEYSN